MVGIDFITSLERINEVFNFANALKGKFVEGREYQRKRIGSVLGELYSWLAIHNTEDIRLYHFHINLWTKEEACAWKDYYISRYSAISVAAAIFASVGQSVLSLEGMTDAHWSANSFLISSMVLGILSLSVQLCHCRTLSEA